MSAMRWCVPAMVAAVAVVVGGGVLRAEDTTEQIIADLTAKAEAVKTLRADLKMTTSIMGQTMTMEGSVLAAAPDRSRMELTMDLGVMKMDQVVVSDGTTVWTYQPAMKSAHRIDIGKVAAETGIEQTPGQQGADLMRPFAGLPPERIDRVRAEQIGDVRAHVFEGTPEVPDLPQIPFKPAKVELWVGSDDGLLRKVVMFDAQGREMISQVYENIEVDVEVPEDTFRFTPPQGVQVTDMTDSVIEMFKAMGKEPPLK